MNCTSAEDQLLKLSSSVSVDDSSTAGLGQSGATALATPLSQKQIGTTCSGSSQARPFHITANPIELTKPSPSAASSIIHTHTHDPSCTSELKILPRPAHAAAIEVAVTCEPIRSTNPPLDPLIIRANPATCPGEAAIILPAAAPCRAAGAKPMCPAPATGSLAPSKRTTPRQN
jgi:hypothetical protein